MKNFWKLIILVEVSITPISVVPPDLDAVFAVFVALALRHQKKLLVTEQIVDRVQHRELCHGAVARAAPPQRYGKGRAQPLLKVRVLLLMPI